MSIRAIIESNIRTLENEKNQAVSAIRETVYREKIIPFNREIDSARDGAIAELTTQLNADIAALQTKYATDKQAIVDAAEKKKAENAESVIATETYMVANQYDKIIASQNDILASMKED